MIRAIFFDIDGTLVSFNHHTVPESALRAISEVRKRGVKVFIATGRPLPFVDNLGPLEYDGIMTVNGAHCETSDGIVVRHQPIRRDDLLRLIDYNRQHPFPMAFAANDRIFITSSSPEALEVLRILNLRCPAMAPIEQCLEMDVMQIIAFFHDADHPRLMSEVLSGCAAQRWHPFFADVICDGSNKAIGIDAILNHYGIAPEEAMAFGDGGNDIAMLRHVGIGVAMGNARDEVKAASRYVTTSVDEDGIARALQHFFLDEA